MSNLSFCQENETYAEHLSSQQADFYRKYADHLKFGTPGGRILDVGC